MMRDVGLEFSREVPASQGRESIVEIHEFNNAFFFFFKYFVYTLWISVCFWP